MSFIMRRDPLWAVASTIALLGVLAPAGRAVAEPAPAFVELLRQSRDTAPRLAEAAANVRQAEGLARQAAARPNPTASVEMEDFNGSGSFRGTNQAQTTFSIGQSLELGGKRGARVAAGRAGLEAARARLVQSRADFAFALADAYGQAEATERRVELAQEGLSLAEGALQVSRALVEAGKEAELRSLQAQAAVTSARAAVNAARAERTGAFARLTALSGSAASFTSLSRSLLTVNTITPPRDIDVLATPAVVAAEAEREAAARRVRVERTRAMPDVTVSGGVRRYNGDDSTAFVAGVSVPIPVFDRTAATSPLRRANCRARRPASTRRGWTPRPTYARRCFRSTPRLPALALPQRARPRPSRPTA